MGIRLKRAWSIFVFVALIAPGRDALAAPETTAPTTAPAQPGRVRLLLPPVIYAVPGIESNVYFDNVVLVTESADYAFDVRCDKGVQFQERWAFTPKDADVGDYPIDVIVRDTSNVIVARGQSMVHVAAKDKGPDKPITLLLVGASWTEYSIYPRHLLDLNDHDAHLRLKLIGSRGFDNGPPTGELRHEGYSGWTAEAFVILHGPLARTGKYEYDGRGSPFVYDDGPDGKPLLDFARYCKQFNDGQPPDVLTIHLIANDIFTATDENIEARCDRMMNFYDQLVNEFHKVGPKTRIGVILSEPPSHSQDGFRNYIGAGKQTQWQYRRDLHRALERMMQHYRDREAEQIYLVPSYINLDTEHNFPTWTSLASARSTEMLTRVNNGTHPNDDGYWQFADSIYCWLKAVTTPPTK
jgi:lysophospholipase L1-like esterase